MFARRCATVRNRPQPFAAVRNRPPKVAMAVPIVSFAKRNIFVVSQRRIASFRLAGVALCETPIMFHDVSEVVLCRRCKTFATFSNDALHFSWQAQHIGDLRCHVAWQAQHFRRVVLRVFRETTCQRCAKW